MHIDADGIIFRISPTLFLRLEDLANITPGTPGPKIFSSSHVDVGEKSTENRNG